MTPTAHTRPTVARSLVVLVLGALLLGASPVAAADAKPTKDKTRDAETFDGFGRKNR